ncbi:glycosyltransferase family 2 protein [Bacteroides oleiciplenus]|uniref:Glycosyltransferase 2-like domain-containing protein n=2 Tax=Bacteroides oleiciplenus TaxID=626931 RepID=K9EKX6_9BACE|nr:glycosyltransferase family 2 protein [Bacteroides oleiciplenus]EKU89800.1 hypothetical protein HMPREF9447_03238 [Bacteroides oleiciplenus YIT 12058]RGN40369.1 glycosyltransferase family 2 protein [Bacteroides oleiciplenus]
MTLAIIIPAYKDTFLAGTLKSLAAQSDQDFSVYIGDDNSPFDIKKVVDLYKGILNIKYVRFNENLGGNNLVAQWERCINLSTEDWIWLFSDDDYMAPDCVKLLKEELAKKELYDIYHCNINVIDRNGETIKRVQYPNVITSKELYKAKLKWKLDCYAVEFIFSRKIYNKSGGFVPFDLAWGSDLATWVKYGAKRGIKTIEGATVYWRSSGENISSIQSEEIVLRKINALIAFLRWGENEFNGKDIRVVNSLGFIKRLLHYTPAISKNACKVSINLFTKNTIHRWLLKFIYEAGYLLKNR